MLFIHFLFDLFLTFGESDGYMDVAVTFCVILYVSNLSQSFSLTNLDAYVSSDWMIDAAAMFLYGNVVMLLIYLMKVRQTETI